MDLQRGNRNRSGAELGPLGAGRVSSSVFSPLLLAQFPKPTHTQKLKLGTKIRTAIIISLIIHIFNISHGHDLPPCGDFAALSLPCSKALWMSSNQEDWEGEYRREYLSLRDGEENVERRILTYQDLLLEDQGRDQVRAGGLGDWFGGMDELGTLVTMAVSTL